MIKHLVFLGAFYSEKGADIIDCLVVFICINRYADVCDITWYFSCAI